MKQAEIKKLNNGLIKCPYNMVKHLMPEIQHIVEQCPTENIEDYYVDAKVHMLMPDQWPCIPDWHCDLVPRNEDNQLMYDKVDTSNKMYLWVSGTPLTEFEDGRKVVPQEWLEFTQLDKHRGTMSTKHQWRLFIRMVPKSLIQRFHTDYIRRHTQVYLNANNFQW